LLKKNSLAANEFIKVVKLYDLESAAKRQDGVPEILKWLYRIEDQYKINARDELRLSRNLLPESNAYQIKHKLYEEFKDLDHICLLLRNGNCSIVTQSKYRIYDSKKSAAWALAFYNNNDQWTIKGLVESFDIEAT
jgi:5-methylcytosine-specific restriction endonuclease McrBC regulatory subunit McrC